MYKSINLNPVNFHFSHDCNKFPGTTNNMRVDTYIAPVGQQTYSTKTIINHGMRLRYSRASFQFLTYLHTLCDFNHSHSQCLLSVCL